MRFIYTAAILLFGGASFQAAGQTGASENKTVTIIAPRAATVDMRAIKTDYFPNLQNVEMPKPGIVTEEDNAELQAAKARIRPGTNGMAEARKTESTLSEPVRVRNFEANQYDGGVPDDNHIAISDSGKIVAVMNSTLNVYDTLGNVIKTVSLDAFSQKLGLTQGKYDPRVLYDPDMDRFVAVCLNGTDDQSSEIVVAFSQTNDPSGTWNLYKITGNPLKDTTWSDFPIIALGKNELFLTLNALQDNKTWQLGFRQSYIWQIDKASGYKGDSLITKVRSGIKLNGEYVRNICPVRGGSGPMGPQTYFLSDKNFSNKTDSIFLMSLSSTLADPNNTLTVNLIHAKTGTYGVAPNAHQPSTPKVARTLQTNDARILDAFIQNNSIQFVANSATAAGKAGVMHGVVSNVSTSPSIAIHILGDTLEFGYPSIAYAGINEGDNDALILVDHTSDTTDPGHSAVFYKAGSYSNAKRIFNGTSFAAISGINERWGDYSGIQRVYNQPGKAWAAGYYGRIVGSGLTKMPGNGARISEIQSPFLPKPLGVEPETAAADHGLTLYPVPATIYSPVTVTFNMSEEQYCSFKIYDVQGKAVADLLEEKVQPGQNMFSFSAHALQKGVYILSIKSDKEVLSKKFVVQ